MRDLARRYHCTVETVRDDVVLRPGFPKPIRPTGSDRLRLWDEGELVKWERTEGRKAA
mgnify:CR=1 FL=1